jgi:translation initiation factor 2 subunit 3
MSAQHSVNISALLEILSTLKLESHDVTKKPLMYVVRSFDVNKPGDFYKDLKGGILGGTLKEGELKVGETIEIKPGIQLSRDGKTFYKPIVASIQGIMTDKDKLDKAIPGGSVGILTKLDPALTHADALVGQVVGLAGTLPDAISQIPLEVHLFKTVMMSEGEVPVKEIVLHEPLMLMVGALATVGITSKANPKEIVVNLKKPVVAYKGEKVIIFKKFEGNKWKIAGFGLVK